jgi:hypothetical protein
MLWSGILQESHFLEFPGSKSCKTSIGHAGILTASNQVEKEGEIFEFRELDLIRHTFITMSVTLQTFLLFPLR